MFSFALVGISINILATYFHCGSRRDPHETTLSKCRRQIGSVQCTVQEQVQIKVIHPKDYKQYAYTLAYETIVSALAYSDPEK